jgi:hypothetical protein
VLEPYPRGDLAVVGRQVDAPDQATIGAGVVVCGALFRSGPLRPAPRLRSRDGRPGGGSHDADPPRTGNARLTLSLRAALRVWLSVKATDLGVFARDREKPVVQAGDPDDLGQ